MSALSPDCIGRLIRAALEVRRAYLAFGPVDDGRPEGEAFESALDALQEAAVDARTASDKLEAFARKILSIHEPLTGEAYPEDRNRYCAVCMSADGGSRRWPCGTVKALRTLLKELETDYELP